MPVGSPQCDGIGYSRRAVGLPCSHEIFRILIESRRLRLSDIHEHPLRLYYGSILRFLAKGVEVRKSTTPMSTEMTMFDANRRQGVQKGLLYRQIACANPILESVVTELLSSLFISLI